MSIISGGEFNKQFQGVNLYKFTNQESCHNNFQYQEGLNVDHLPLTTKYCSAGGLYFTTHNENFSKWFLLGLLWVWDVTIPDDAQVVIEPDNKAKTDKFILSNQRYIQEMKEWNNYEVSLSLIQHKGDAIRFIKDPSEELKLAALQQFGLAIRYFKDPSETLILAAVMQNGSTIVYIKDPSEEVQLASVQQFGCAIKYIDNPSEKVMLAAVMQDRYAIKYIDNPSEAVKQISDMQK